MSKDMKPNYTEAFKKAFARSGDETLDDYGDVQDIFRALMATCGFSQYDKAIRSFGGKAPPFEWEGTREQSDFHDLASEKWDEEKEAKQEEILARLEDSSEFARLAEYLGKFNRGEELPDDIEDAPYRIVREAQRCIGTFLNAVYANTNQYDRKAAEMIRRVVR